MAVWRRREQRDSLEIRRRIEHALSELQPMLRAHMLVVELAGFELEPGIVALRFTGDCPDCQMSASVLRSGVEAHLRRQIPEIRDFRAV